MNPNRRKVFTLVGAAALSGLVGCGGGGGNKNEVAALKIANNSLYSFDKVDLTTNTDITPTHKLFFVDPANSYEQPIEKIAGSTKNIFVLPPVVNQVRGKIRVKNADNKVTHEGDITVTPIPVASQPGQLAKDYTRATIEINRQGLIAAQKGNDVKAVDTITKLNELTTENLKLIDAVMASGTTVLATSATGNKLQMSTDDLKRMDQFVAKMSYEIGLKNVKLNTTPQPQNIVATTNPIPTINPPTTVNPSVPTNTVPVATAPVIRPISTITPATAESFGYTYFNGAYYTSSFQFILDPATGLVTANPNPAATSQAYAASRPRTLASTTVINQNTSKADAPFLADAIPESAITNFDGSKAAPGTSDREYQQMVSVLTTFEQAANVVNASAVISGLLVTAAVAGIVIFAAPATAVAAVATAGVIADVWVGTVIGVNAASILAKYIYDKPSGFTINDESKAIFDAGLGKIVSGPLDKLGEGLSKITATHVFTPNSYGAAAARASGELVKTEIGEQLGKGTEPIFSPSNTTTPNTTTPSPDVPSLPIENNRPCPPGQNQIFFGSNGEYRCSSRFIQ